MHIEQHALIKEFPEHKDKIHVLKMDNSHFARLFEEYHQIDHEIVRLEDGVENASDDELETMKKQRLKLKDQLYGMLVET